MKLCSLELRISAKARRLRHRERAVSKKDMDAELGFSRSWDVWDEIEDEEDGED